MLHRAVQGELVFAGHFLVTMSEMVTLGEDALVSDCLLETLHLWMMSQEDGVEVGQLVEPVQLVHGEPLDGVPLGFLLLPTSIKVSWPCW